MRSTLWGIKHAGLLLSLIILGLSLSPAVAQTCHPDGDLNGDSQVTPADALRTFRHFLGIANPPLPACERVRANVLNPTTSGITPADALCIFRFFLGVPSCLDGPPLGTAFLSVSVLNRTYPNVGVVEAPAVAVFNRKNPNEDFALAPIVSVINR